MIGFNYKKAVQSLNYFAEKNGGRIEKIKAIKLIWAANRYHLRKYGRPIYEDKYYAMEWGTVPSLTKDLSEKDNSFIGLDEKTYRDQFIEPIKNIEISSKQPVEKNVFSKSDLAVLEKVYLALGNKDWQDLSNLTHFYPEWLKYKMEFDHRNATRFPQDIMDFFKNPEDLKDDFFKIGKEDLELSKERYLERERIS